jgi:hypothetical protein
MSLAHCVSSYQKEFVYFYDILIKGIRLLKQNSTADLYKYSGIEYYSATLSLHRGGRL